MGCWNGTCGLSNLPIHVGDDILLFVLTETKSTRGDLGGGFSYPTGRYTPVGLPVHGKYNDYGGIEHITTNGELMFDFLTTDRRFKLKLNDGVDIEMDDIEIVLNDIIERGESNYSFMLVRKDIFDGMKAKNVTEYADFAPQFPVFLDGFNKELEIVKSERGEDFHELLHAQFAIMELPERIGYSNIFLRLLESYEVPSLKQFVMKAVQQPDAGLQDSIIDVAYLTRLLGDLRKFWTVQSGAGSQDNAHDIHMALCDTMKDVCAKRDRDYAAEYGDE